MESDKETPSDKTPEESEHDSDNSEQSQEEDINEDQSVKQTNGVFISGIPYTTPESELRELFEKYGEITSMKVPKYQDSGKNIGYAHIYYTSKASAKKALELNNHKIGARYITVNLAKQNSEELHQPSKVDTSDIPSSCLTAFVKNLPYDVTEKQVGDKFRSCGRIKDIRFSYNSVNKKFKGFCFIDFKEHQGLIKAVELNGKEFMGRKLFVDYEVKKPKKGYKYNNERVTQEYNKDHMYLLKKKRKNK